MFLKCLTNVLFSVFLETELSIYARRLSVLLTVISRIYVSSLIGFRKLPSD
jgi:hypothetical protein